MRRFGVSILDLGIVAVLAGWFGSLAFSVGEASRFRRSEEVARNALWAVHELEQEVRAIEAVDRNGDGVGEHAFLGEIAFLVRSGRAGRGEEPSAAAGLRPVGAGAYATADQAYLLTAYLPDESGQGLDESQAERVSPVEAARCFILYAWPAAYSRTGLRAFCLTAGGRLLVTENGTRQYGGRRRRPPPNAALAKSEPLCGSSRAASRSADRQAWLPFSR